MKEYREEAEKHRKAKLEKYGADRKACGGSMHKYAHGGHVEHNDEKEDKALIKKEVKPDCLKHRADGGPIAGSGGPRLGRGRKGGKSKGRTQVNIAIGKPGGDSAGAPPMPPPAALGSGPSAMPPKPIMPPPGAGPAMPPRPGMPPMKRGGKVHEKKHGHNERHARKEHKHQAR